MATSGTNGQEPKNLAELAALNYTSKLGGVAGNADALRTMNASLEHLQNLMGEYFTGAPEEKATAERQILGLFGYGPERRDPPPIAEGYREIALDYVRDSLAAGTVVSAAPHIEQAQVLHDSQGNLAMVQDFLAQSDLSRNESPEVNYTESGDTGGAPIRTARPLDLNVERMFETYGYAPASDSVETVKLNDGKIYVLMQETDGAGGRDFVLRTPGELASDIENDSTNPDVMARLQESLQAQVQHMIRLREEAQRTGVPESSVPKERMATPGLDAVREQMGVLAQAALFSSFAGMKAASEPPDYDMTATPIDEVPPSVKAAVLRHGGNEDGAEATERTIAAPAAAARPRM